MPPSSVTTAHSRLAAVVVLIVVAYFYAVVFESEWAALPMISLTLSSTTDNKNEANASSSQQQLAAAAITACSQQHRESHVNGNMTDSNQQQQQQQQRITLPPVHVNSTWVGNMWIPPPGYHLYTPLELKQYFSNESILFFGDSIARRLMTTMYAMLNVSAAPLTTIQQQSNSSNTTAGGARSTASDVLLADLQDPRVIDINRKKARGIQFPEYCAINGTSVCRPNPGATRMSLNQTRQQKLVAWGGHQPGSTGCTRHIYEFFDSQTSWVRQSLDRYTLVILSTGTWDQIGKPCTVPNTDLEVTIQRAVDSLANLPQRDNLTIVYRTWVTMSKESQEPLVNRANVAIRNAVERHEQEYLARTGKLSSLTYLDWGTVMMPRSTEERRIQGDMKAHFGYEARFVFIQMLINHLVKRRNFMLDYQQTGVVTSNVTAS